ncbi:NADPH-dependent FMN reductase [Streptomyces sp. NPDC006711]|uniref:NADPH-dependent FMN reductase n=1 Tax=Streptomyces sp. NPDC006711 TaxID=3364762 RepID=UPI0036C72680
MKAICVAGSPNHLAWSRRLLREVTDGLAERGWDTDVLDLRDLKLPLLDVQSYQSLDPYPDPVVQDWRNRVAAADAVVLSTPVHHASYSGLLKCALDFLVADAFAGRAVGLLSNGGAARGATLGCEHLRSVVKALGGWPVPTQVATCAQDFDAETRTLSNRALIRRCGALCDELTQFTRAMRPPRTDA